MARNNVKLLTKHELNTLNSLYFFKFDEKNVIVGNKHYNRTTLHDRDKPFSINSKVRKITITTDAISMWISLQDDKKYKDYSLFDVQNVINCLYVLYQPCNLKNVKKGLEKLLNR